MTAHARNLTSTLLGISMLMGITCKSVKKQNNIHLVWEVQNSNTTWSFRGVAAVSSQVCWVSGSSGTVLRTSDGGTRWEIKRVDDAASLDFRDIQAFDKQTALVISAGEPAKIYKTTDGGDTWAETYSNTTPGIFFDAMDFWDEQNGIGFSDPVEGQLYLIRTTDGGNSWQRIDPRSFPLPESGEAGFAASGTCLTVHGDSLVWFGTGGSKARVFRSTNRGASWTIYETSMLSGNPAEGIFSVTFMDQRFGVIVGGNYQNLAGTARNAAWTTDGGIIWHGVTENPPTGFRECAVYLYPDSPDCLLTVGPSGSDISRDGGRTWTQADSLGFHSVSFLPEENTGWAVGGEGRIAKIINRAQ
jgi:photosystem II stability/assembly factor-like uncharacterized protein